MLGGAGYTEFVIRHVYDYQSQYSFLELEFYGLESLRRDPPIG